MRKLLLTFGSAALAFLVQLRKAAGAHGPLRDTRAIETSDIPGDVSSGLKGGAVTRAVIFRHKQKQRGHRRDNWRSDSPAVIPDRRYRRFFIE